MINNPSKNTEMGIDLTCPRCLFTSDIAEVPRGGGQCNYCDLHDQLEASARPEDLDRQLAKVRGTSGQYNCIIGISGGLDSSTLLWLAVRKWSLRPLVVHFDNGWNGEAATANMRNLCNTLDVPVIVYHPAKREYDELNRAFLYAGLPDADIPNDIAMTKFMYQTAAQHGIKWILNGHDFRQVGSTPAKWTYMDAKYIQSVFYAFRHKKLIHYPLFTFLDQVKYGLKGIKQIRPFHYIVDRWGYEQSMKNEIEWQDYGAKHGENIYTEYVGAQLLPEKFGIDKRRVYVAADLRSGKLNKREAQNILAHPPGFNMSKLGTLEKQIKHDSSRPIGKREDYDRYDFRAWYMKAIVWLLAKFKVVPHTFYKKYCC